MSALPPKADIETDSLVSFDATASPACRYSPWSAAPRLCWAAWPWSNHSSQKRKAQGPVAALSFWA